MAKVDFGGMLSNGGSRFNGLVSGVDVDSLINAAVEKKKTPVELAQKEVDFNLERIAAFGVLNNKLSRFQTALTNVKGLRFLESGTNTLDARVADLSSSSTSTPSNYLSVSVDSGASMGSFDISISQLAKNKIIQSSSFASSTTSATNAAASHSNTALFTAGTFQINGVSITIAQDASLVQIANTINLSSSQTNVQAQIINPASGDYRLVLKSTLTGSANGITFTDTDNVLNSLYSGGSTVLQASQDAVFKYNNNVTVTKSSNTVNDFIDGVTFDLKAVTNNGSSFNITVDVDHDIDTAVAGIKEFVDSYNDLMKFAAEQQGRDKNGNYYDTAKIQQHEYLSNIISDVSALAGKLAYVEDSANNFGIDFEYVATTNADPSKNKNLLSLNEDQLRASLKSDFNTIKKQFDFEMTTNSDKLLVYGRGSKLDSASFSIDIDTSRSASDRVRVTYGGSTINMTFEANNAADLTQGATIKGVAGTVFEGYEFIYSGTGVDTISCNMTQGAADKIFNVVNAATKINTSTGTSIFQQDVISIAQDNAGMLKDIERKLTEIEAYKEELIEKYSRMEAELAKSNAILTMMDVQLKVMSGK
jgi:flagellar hook-associated protein 2